MINDIVRKIEMCIDYQTLYALEDDFNNIGLTVQVTSNNKVTLCKLIDGKAKADKIIDDYIYIGSLDGLANEISQNATTKIIAFVRASSGQADKVKDKARGWKDGIRMYGKAIRIGEDKERGEAISEGRENTYPITES
jgi:hypothetical protein